MSANHVMAITLAVSGAAKSTRGNVMGIYYVAGASAGTIDFKNGGSGGTTIFTIATPAGATLTGYILIPQDGVTFSSDIYVTITNATSVTVFYQ